MLPTTLARRRHLPLRGGGRVHVVEAGEGPPAVFLHGTNTSALSWVPLLGHLGDIRMIAVDRPGRGLSDPAPPSPRAGVRAAAVRFLDDVLTELEIECPTLVGQSGGGVCALWYLLAHPERVNGLVLVGSTPLLPGTRPPAPLRIAATPVVGDLLSRLVKPTPKTVVRLLSSVGEGETILQHPQLLQALVAGGNDPVAADADLDELQALIHPFGFRRSMRLRADDLRTIDVPTLLIWGDHDPVGSVAVARAAAGLIPNAHLEVLDAGHVPQLGHPNQTADLVSSFVRRAQGQA